MFRKNLKLIWFSCLVAFLSWVGFFSVSLAQERVQYQESVIVDSDFDGLTDQGETQIYQTDPNNQDTDGDGFYDGSEILYGTDPLNFTSPLDFELAEQIKKDIVSETPWAWYVTRSAGLVAFGFLWLSVFLGLSIRNNWLKKLVAPVYSFEFHCFLGASALFWALVHGTSILFDRYFGMKWRDVFIPFHFDYPNFRAGSVDFLALGIIALYAMIILVATSYLKNRISHKFWRVLHFLNPLVFIFVALHGLYLGTDLKSYAAQKTFLLSTLFLILVYFSSLVLVLWNKWKSRNVSEDSNA